MTVVNLQHEKPKSSMKKGARSASVTRGRRIKHRKGKAKESDEDDENDINDDDADGEGERSDDKHHGNNDADNVDEVDDNSEGVVVDIDDDDFIVRQDRSSLAQVRSMCHDGVYPLASAAICDVGATDTPAIDARQVSRTLLHSLLIYYFYQLLGYLSGNGDDDDDDGDGNDADIADDERDNADNDDDYVGKADDGDNLYDADDANLERDTGVEENASDVGDSFFSDVPVENAASVDNGSAVSLSSL